MNILENYADSLTELLERTWRMWTSVWLEWPPVQSLAGQCRKSSY